MFSSTNTIALEFLLNGLNWQVCGHFCMFLAKTCKIGRNDALKKEKPLIYDMKTVFSGKSLKDLVSFC